MPITKAIRCRLLAIITLLVGCQTPDTSPPIVQSVWPENETTGVPLDARIQVQFSEPMAQTATELSFALQPHQPGLFVWSGPDRLCYVPNWNLTPLTSYTVTIGVGAQDIAGNPLTEPFIASFTTGDSLARGIPVFMLGRSVMSGWFDHWGSDPYYYRHFTLRYQELEPPPTIAVRAREIIATSAAPAGSIFFFKLCFDDFTGGSQEEATANLERNFDYVQQVYDSAIRGSSWRLIVGNALPKVQSATDEWLVWNHRQYNARLNSFAQEHERIQVFDFYSVLSDTGGALKPGFAARTEDSHLNAAGYAALDTLLFRLFESPAEMK